MRHSELIHQSVNHEVVGLSPNVDDQLAGARIFSGQTCKVVYYPLPRISPYPGYGLGT